nr:immunoglobulin heavy chain junction region [Macaca mulatta]MOW99440.1 immunoglobulin heavy chain junction region [Macaca mulatta]MOW99595.1 immunoglobulin heavy chain junction region [Macaca mulatta]MOX03927.1 immunoglobulin heavy chain junction region [Macaca mulatta]MOX04841.1 immunoglobulin heavy chain junction region [Macaca mulatta]
CARHDYGTISEYFDFW